MRGIPVIVLAVLVITTAACAPSAPREGAAAGGPRPEAAPTRPDRTLVVATRVEPTSLAWKALQPSGISPNGPGQLFHASLAVLDDRLVPHAYLAEELPQLNTDTWRVFPDGKMETTYRLRPNLTWHDGTPFTADDVVFAWQVYRQPEFEGARNPVGSIEEAVAVDPRTVLIRWRKPWPEARAVTGDRSGMPPLPRHILESTFQQGNLEVFASHPWWSVQFVGLAWIIHEVTRRHESGTG